ncbi:M23 family metallopeptidase [Mesorhizobium sp. M0854]|uniref:M23 family metallopeptidase n=1 Tax=Mesorhizobium sp. M0854 TaxID=2957013 RepID=UPI003335D086
MSSQNDDDVRKSLFEQGEDGTVRYETQVKPADNSGYAGELRGFYPDTSPQGGVGVWLPKYSTKGGRPGGTHDGIDIYAPYFDFPLETPIYAMVSGTATAKSNALDPNDIGNRIWLWPENASGDTRYIFGHLNRFRGRFKPTYNPGQARKVRKGELIGYAGHSGNADEHREASSIGEFYINAGHVHLKWQKAGAVGDGAIELGWKLRFNKPGELGPLHLDQFKTQLRLDTKISRSPQKGLLGARSRGPETTPWNAPATSLGEPFELIDVDDRNALHTTYNAHALMAKRLKSEQTAHRDRGVERFQSDINEWVIYKNKETTDKSRLYRLFDEIKTRADSFKKNGSGEDCSTDVVLLLLATYQALYVLMGGPSLHDVARKAPPASSGAVVDCGIGPGGTARALSAGHGQAVMQHVWLAYRNDKGEVALRDTVTMGVSFGAGTEWHAIMDETILAKDRLPDTTQPQKLVRELVTATFRLGDTATYVFDLAQRNSALIRTGRKDTNYRRFKQIDGFVDAIVKLIAEIKGLLPHLGWKEDANGAEFNAAKPAIATLLQQAAETGSNALDAAIKAFEQGSTAVPRVTPQVGMLWLEPYPITQN